MDLEPGGMVTPELRLWRELGSGAMGTIWSAQRVSGGQSVAIKFMSPRLLAADPQLLKRFEREALILQGVVHPNIVQLVSSGSTATGTAFIVLELMEGEPLVDELERDGVFEVDEVARLVEQLAAALETLHQRGIIHRDVKAENIFISRASGAPTIKLFDFGLAKRADEVPAAGSFRKPLTGVGMMVGTAEYMSPEQMTSSKDADFRADLWALAVVAYVVLCGGLPFSGKNVAQIFAKFAKMEFQRPSAIRDDITPELDQWFERAFQTDVRDRFDSAATMASTFRQAAGGGARAPSLPASAVAHVPAANPGGAQGTAGAAFLAQPNSIGVAVAPQTGSAGLPGAQSHDAPLDAHLGSAGGDSLLTKPWFAMVVLAVLLVVAVGVVVALK